MTDRLALATRSMKARRTSVCTICHAVILVGQQIAKVIQPEEWVHIGCLPIVARVQRGEWPSNRLGRSGLAATAATKLKRTPGVPGLFFLVRDNGGMAGKARERRSSVTSYGADHVRVRRLAVAAYRIGDPCVIGGEPLTVPAALLDLAHNDAHDGYLGLACQYHNRSEGARRAPRRRGPLPRVQRKAIAWKAGRWR